MLSRFFIFILLSVVLTNNHSNNRVDCKHVLSNTYQEITSYEARNNFVGNIPIFLKNRLNQELSLCKDAGETFFLTKDFLNANSSVLISYLDLSIMSGNIDLFEHFMNLEKSAPLDMGNHPHFIAEWSYLHVAAVYGDHRHIKELLYGQDIDVKDAYGSTPLMTAINHFENFKYLIDNGANPYIENKSGRSVVCWAKTLNLKKVSSLLSTKGYECKINL